MIAKAETTTTAVSAATRAREGAEVLRVKPAGAEHAAKRDARSGDFESAKRCWLSGPVGMSRHRFGQIASVYMASTRAKRALRNSLRSARLHWWAVKDSNLGPAD
jgi:hypothetical protein